MPPSSLPSPEKPTSLLVVEAEKGHLLYTAAHRQAIAERTCLLHPGALTDREVLARPDLLAACEVLFTGWGGLRLDAKLLETMPRLSAVFSASGTIKGFVTPEFWASKIPIAAAASANAIPVAEYTLAAVIFGLKRVLHHAAAQRAGAAWRAPHPLPGCYRTTVGLVSFGFIARRVRELLRSLDVEVLVHDPYLTREEAARHEVESIGLVELFTRSHAISLHTPSLPETRNLVRASHLESLQSGSVFINTARGSIVHEGELAVFLEKRPDVQAFLDITDPEPPAADSPLRRLPNVVLSPHIAGSIGDECGRMGNLMIAEYDRWRAGENLRHAITQEQSVRMA